MPDLAKGRPVKFRTLSRSRPVYLLLVVLTAGVGLLWRSALVPIPPFLAKYGGDSLWALMVFFGFGFLFRRVTTFHLSLIALGFAWAIEFSQLYQAPWIESVRAARLGHLVLGSTFNWPDLPAYAVGVAIGAMAELAFQRFAGSRNPGVRIIP